MVVSDNKHCIKFATTDTELLKVPRSYLMSNRKKKFDLTIQPLN